MMTAHSSCRQFPARVSLLDLQQPCAEPNMTPSPAKRLEEDGPKALTSAAVICLAVWVLVSCACCFAPGEPAFDDQFGRAELYQSSHPNINNQTLLSARAGSHVAIAI